MHLPSAEAFRRRWAQTHEHFILQYSKQSNERRFAQHSASRSGAQAHSFPFTLSLGSSPPSHPLPSHPPPSPLPAAPHSPPEAGAEPPPPQRCRCPPAPRRTAAAAGRMRHGEEGGGTSTTRPGRRMRGRGQWEAPPPRTWPGGASRPAGEGRGRRHVVLRGFRG